MVGLSLQSLVWSYLVVLATDALIIQAVADALKVTTQIVESYQGFAPLTTVYPVQERNTSSTITIGHIYECHYVSTTALQSNASISMCNE